MPTFYNFTQDGNLYSFDDIFVPADAFRQGGLYTWGLNNTAQLGNNNTTGRSTPVTTFAGGTNWKQVAAGNGHVAAIKADGTLWVWGANGNGQLGDNTTATRTTPVTTFAGGTNWKQVAAGNSHTAAIKTDGTLWVWGAGGDGQLGGNNIIPRSTPVTTFTGGTNWKQVSAGTTYTAAIKTDGTLWTWGQGISGQLGNDSIVSRSIPVTTFAGGTNWKQVVCGSDHTVAIKTDGTLWLWGSNGRGQLGINDTTNRNTPVTTFAGETNWKQIDCGTEQTYAIKTDGTLWLWGRNNSAQLGTNDTADRTTPVTTFAGGTNWKQATGSRGFGRHTAAIKTDGTLWAWGLNTNSPLGTNDTTTRSTPVTTFAGGTNWKQVSCISEGTTATQYEVNAEIRTFFDEL